MSGQRIHGKRRAITASSVLDAVGHDLTHIRSEDGLRWVDIGEVLGRGEDQAAKYADGSATMDVVSFAKGRAAWGSRFTGSLDRLIEAAVTDELCGHETLSRLLRAATEISDALHDGHLCDADIRKSRSILEHARDDLDAQLARLRPRKAEA